MERTLKIDLVKEKPETSKKKDGLLPKTAWQKFKEKLAKSIVILGISVAVAIPCAVSCNMDNPNFKTLDASADTDVDTDTDSDVDTDTDSDTDTDGDGGVPGWQYSEVCFNSGVDAELADFPAFLSFDHASKVSDGKSQGEGSDIYFTDDSGSDYWDFELENNTNNTSNMGVWVKLPTFSAQSSDTCGRIYYSGSEDSLHEENAPEVWSNNFYLVYHMSEAPPSNLQDSTGNGYEATPNSLSGGDLVDGIRGKAISFSGSQWYDMDSSIDYPTSENIGTISFWYKPSTISSILTPICKSTMSSSYYFNAYLLPMNADVDLVYYTRAGAENSGKQIDDTDLPTGTWELWAGSGDGITNHKMYRNGEEETTVAYYEDSTNRFFDMGDSWKIGTFFRDVNLPPSSAFQGIIDEIRFATVTRSDEWIFAENAQTYSIGAETAVD